MTNKGFNPLFVSALDILTGALGVFIILNFLNTRLMGVPPVPTNPPGSEKKTEAGKPQAAAKPRPAESPREWWRKPPPPTAPVKPQVPTQPTTHDAKPQNPNPQSTNNQQSTTDNQQSAPRDPVEVDLMKQTKGAVVILLQQADQAKQSVEFMLRQGNRSWKPNSASKYQNSEFKYEKRLVYFYQMDIQPGTYEVLVRVKKGQRNAGTKPFSLYGKILPPGQKSQTYTFGTFALNGETSEWTPAGTFKINATDLQYQSKLPVATKAETTPAGTNTPVATKPVSTPKPKPSGRNGKWG